MTEEQQRTAHSIAELLKREPQIAKEIRLSFGTDEQLVELLGLRPVFPETDFFERPKEEYLQSIRECVPLAELIDFYRF